MYSIRAVVGVLSDLKNIRLPSSTAVVSLDEVIGLIPLTDEALDELGNGQPFSDERPYPKIFEGLSASAFQWIATASANTTLAYIEAEYTGGVGGQSSIIWRNGKIVGEPRQGTNPINEALRMFDVKARPPHDEFDTIGLGRHRRLEDWVQAKNKP